jgi:hypothetical protein
MAALLALAALAAAPGAPCGPDARADRVRGDGAAGVLAVGRPLDVVREGAARQARQRAVESLAGRAVALYTARAGVHKAPEGDAGQRARALASGKDALWQMSYWSNGAVTARVAVDAAALLGGD